VVQLIVADVLVTLVAATDEIAGTWTEVEKVKFADVV
jgi:hypothetical protein